MKSLLQTLGQLFDSLISVLSSEPSASLKQRGVWLTETDSRVLTSDQTIKSAIDQLALININTLYPAVWRKGYTLYPSSVAAKAIGASTLPNSAFQTRDMLAEFLTAAKSHSFRVIPWLEYGLMAPPQSPLAQQHSDWLTCKADGNPIHNGMVWLNPAHPDVIQFITSLIGELVEQYQIDGIQLDDHFAMPIELGYDEFTIAQYRQQTGAEPPQNPADRQWMAWRTDRLTDLMRHISQAVKARNPNCLISLSPNPYSFSLSKYLMDWQHWIQADLIDELVVQLYRDQLMALKAELAKPELIAARQRIPVSIGLLSGLRTKSVSFAQIQQQVAAVKQQGFTGVSFFFYETVLLEKLEPKTVGDRSTKKWQNILDSKR